MENVSKRHERRPQGDRVLTCTGAGACAHRTTRRHDLTRNDSDRSGESIRSVDTRRVNEASNPVSRLSAVEDLEIDDRREDPEPEASLRERGQQGLAALNQNMKSA